MVQENSVEKPKIFCDTVSTTVYITDRDEGIQLDVKEAEVYKYNEKAEFSEARALPASPFVLAESDFNLANEKALKSNQNIQKVSKSMNHQLDRREPHTPHFVTPVQQQVVPVGGTITCAMLDGVSFSTAKSRVSFLIFLSLPLTCSPVFHSKSQMSKQDLCCVIGCQRVNISLQK